MVAQGTLGILPPCSLLLCLATAALPSSHWLLILSSSGLFPSTLTSTGKTLFFSRHITHCKLSSGYPYAQCCWNFMYPKHQQPSTIKYTSSTRKSHTYFKVLAESPAAWSSTVHFYLGLNSSLCFPLCQTRPSFCPERRPPNPVDCTFKHSWCSCSFYPLHALTISPASTPSVCLDCCNKMLLIKLLRKYRNVCLPVLEAGVYDWCPEERQCLVRAVLKVAIFSLWPHGVEDASNSQGSLLWGH